jgi:hypothetical protein
MPPINEEGPEAPGPPAGSAEAPAAAIERLARRLEGVQVGRRGEVIEYLRGGVVFATGERDRHSFRLRPEIARAGLRTNGASPSAAGPDWIGLDTVSSDEFTLDRARAWFELAWRLAGNPEPESGESGSG